MNPVRILIVDDDRFVREMLKDMLGPEGHQLDEASDGAQALAKVQTGAFDLVLLDLFMPNMSGMEALGKLRELAPDSKVVVISSLDAPSLVAQAKAAGAT